jgi:hypothetical protein
MEEEYNSKNIDKALRWMENSDELREIKRESSHISKWFDTHAEDNDIEPLPSPTENKKENYLKKIKLLYILILKKGNKKELNKLNNIETLIKTTDFLNLSKEKQEKLKNYLIWCNKKYEKYLDS